MRLIKRILYILFTWFLIHEIAIIIDGLNDEEATSGIVIVFGNKIEEDGTLSKRLKARLDKALELYQANKSINIFVSGGLGKEGFLEGDKMADYLIQNEVPKNQIIIDNKGNNSMLTAQNFCKLYPKISTVTIVSQFYHISRAKLAFNKLGVSKVEGVHCDYYEARDIYSLFREFFGFYKYLLIY